MSNSQGSEQSHDNLYKEVQTLAAKGDIPGAITVLDKILGLLGDEQPLQRAKVLSNKGFMLASMQGFEDAEEAFQQALEIFRDENSPVNMAIQIGNIGSINRDMGNYSKALGYYEEALAILTKHDYKPAIADQHSNIAYACSQNGDGQKALAHFEQAREVYVQLGDEHRAAQCTQNIEAIQNV